MERHRKFTWVMLSLIPCSFAGAIVMCVFAFLDALVGSPWYVAEFTAGLACALSFVSLLTSDDVLHRPT